jgi:hypothetical protein
MTRCSLSFVGFVQWRRFEGEWMDDKRHGDGKCVFANGDAYQVPDNAARSQS